MLRIVAILLARLKEFYRDRASLGWNFMFPFFIVVAFYFIFTGGEREIFKVGVVGLPTPAFSNPQLIEYPSEEFFKIEQIQFIPIEKEEGLKKVSKHGIDMLLEVPHGKATENTTGEHNYQYWVNSSSPNGSILERILKGAVTKPIAKNTVEGAEIRYIDWVFPGVLCMNLMFSCLWGVGWVVVKYRQEGYLKRLNATPLKAYQFLLGQVGARYIISFIVTLIVYVGCKWIIGFEMQGSYFDLFIVYSIGVTCLISMGLAVASRTTSKEFADGVLNLLSWPMMMLSEVWFSMEGASEGILMVSQVLPLTHMVQASRLIMTEGASLIDVWQQVFIMILITVVLITLSSLAFKWSEE